MHVINSTMVNKTRVRMLHVISKFHATAAIKGDEMRQSYENVLCSGKVAYDNPDLYDTFYRFNYFIYI